MNKFKSGITIISTLLIAILLILGCDSNPPTKPDPNAPIFNSTISPENAATNQPFLLTLSWNCFDPDSEEVKYDLYFGEDKNLDLIAENLVNSYYIINYLESGTHYSWKVIATDKSGNSTFSPRYEFYTMESPVYPLAVGNSWEYDGLATEVNVVYNSYGSPELVIDTVLLSSVVTITSIDTLLTDLEVFRFDEFVTEGSNTYHGINYFNNDGHGFYNYAYENANGKSVTPLSDNSEVIYNFRGHQFHRLAELSDFIKMKFNNTQHKAFQITYEDPPVRSLSYPLMIGSQWTMRQPGQPWQIDKIVNDLLFVTVPAGTFDTYQIIWLYDMDNNQDWDDDINITDYINSSGLVKRDVQLLGIYLTGPEGDSLGVTDYFESWDLTNYDIKSLVSGKKEI